MRIKFVGEPAQHLPGGPLWEPGEEQDLADDQAAVYLRNANWQRVDVEATAAAKDRAPGEDEQAAPSSTEEQPQTGAGEELPPAPVGQEG